MPQLRRGSGSFSATADFEALAADALDLGSTRMIAIMPPSSWSRMWLYERMTEDASTIVIDFGPQVLSFSPVMRLLVEILIIAAVIYVGWNKPYKEYATNAKTSITAKLDGLGGNLQKHEDSSVKRYQAKP